MSSTDPHPVRPSARAMALAVGVAAVHALWTLFQWTQLVAARTGGSAFCPIGDGGSCAEIWDSPFASAIQGWTGVPVAGWGLVWSVAATVLPLWALVQRAERGTEGLDGDTVMGSAWAATVWMALGGLAGIGVLVTASLAQGGLCATCVATYTVVAIYAAICLVQTPLRTVPLARGVSLASGTLALAFVLLFIPGLRTPLPQDTAGREALEEVTERASSSDAGEPRPAADARLADVARLLERLPPQLRQAFSDELARYRNAPHVPMRPARSLVGEPGAPVRLTEFTDVLCSHCKSLHETLEQLMRAVPDGALAVEPRHFPLDPACNPEIEGESRTPVRCLAARSVICLEDHPQRFAFSGRIYENQASLDEEKVYELAEPLVPRSELAACVNDPGTDEKLRDDIAWAAAHDIQGTPLVLLNGRPVAAFPPLLYALIATGGDAEHRVFDGLPEPDPASADPHAGHAH